MERRAKACVAACKGIPTGVLEKDYSEGKIVGRVFLLESRSRERLKQIAEIIEQVDQRCMAADGPVTPTDEEITLEEIQRIYDLATGMLNH